MAGSTKEERVAAFLREGIISGRFARGRRLKQAEIAAMLGLSITPVREAIKLLEAEGYVRTVARRGAVVAPLDLLATRETVELRVMLECRLVQAALERLGDADVRALAALQRELAAVVRRGEADAVRALNYRFHHRLYALAERPQTLHFVNVLWSRYPFDLINRLHGRVERTAHEHDALLAALAARDAPAAVTALRDHILQGWQELQRAGDALAGPLAG